MKNKKDRAGPEIISVSNDVGFRKSGDKPEYRCAEKIHGNRKEDTNDKIDQQKIIQECHGRLIAFFFTKPHWFWYENGCINTVDKARKQDHGGKHKKVNIGFDITAKIPGNNDG